MLHESTFAVLTLVLGVACADVFADTLYADDRHVITDNFLWDNNCNKGAYVLGFYLPTGGKKKFHVS